MSTVTTALVPTPDDSPERIATEVSLAEAERRLSELAQDGNAELLHEVAAQATAHHRYQEREQNRARANHFARMKLLAEAALGRMSIEAQPRLGSRAEPVVLGGREVNAAILRRWRVLAVAQERGLLNEALDRAEQYDLVTTGRVAALLERTGATLVPRSALKQVADSARRPLWRIAADAGVSEPRNRAATWRVAKAICEQVDSDASSLPVCEPRRNGHGAGTSKRRWIRRERKRTGGRWDECYSRLRLLIDEFAQLAPEADTRFDDAYAHLYELEQFIGREMRRAA